ncbi:YbaN family protein [Magnetovibrio sp.]|uniref:YbaN family protein n=1 Tax=Magnetovibrio sp. TaxID=2024836 RepID=UPI002F924642
MQSAPPPPTCKRVLFLGLGWLFFCLGVVGAFLPVMPTTVFMIMALWAFANSSRNLHTWLYTHEKFGPALQQWDRERVIPVHAKLAALGGMLISLIYVTVFSGAPPLAIAAAVAFIAFGAVYVISKPSRIAQAVPVSQNDNNDTP